MSEQVTENESPRFPWLRSGLVMLLSAGSERDLQETNPMLAGVGGSGHAGVMSYPSEIGPGGDGSSIQRAVDICRAQGVRMMCHYGGVLNDAAGEAHPEWLRRGPDGQPGDTMLGTPICLNSSYLEEWVLPQLKEMFELWHPQALWIDGECWAVGPCYCERCRQLFHGETGLEVPEIDPDHPWMEATKGWPASPALEEDKLWREWMAFHRRCFRRYQKAMADLCHQYDVAYASNWSHTWINPDPVPEWLDWITGDIPGGPHGAIQASMRVRFDNTQGIPHDLMTWDYTSPDVWGDPAVKPYAKGYGQLLQEVAVSLAGGAIWHSWTSRSLPAALWPIADFVHEREELFLGSSSVPEVALLHSAATYYVHSRGYMTFNPQELISIYYPGDAYLRGAHRALAESGIHFDIINEENLRPRLAEYPLVVLAEQTHLSPETIVALREYVRQGGIILATGRTACADEIDTALADVLGITIQGPIDEPEGFLVVDPALIDEPSGLADVGPALLSLEADWQRVQPQEAEVVAEFYPTTHHSSGLQRPDFSPGEALPAVTVNRFGEGRAVYMACDVFRAYETTCYYGVRRYIDTLLRRAQPQRTVEIQAPFYVEVFVRRQPGCTLVHLVNKGLITDNPAKGRQFEQVAPTGPVKVHLRLPKAPSRVTLEPEGLVPEHTYQEGLLAVALPQIEGVLASIVAWD